MPIKPAFAYDICWEVYQALKAEQEGIGILDPAGSSNHSWRPHSGASGDEYIADFALAARAPFLNPTDPSRLILVQLFYVQLGDYRKIRRQMGISEYIWSVWADDIREKAGREVMRRGLFPPKTYFGERSRPRRCVTRSTASGAVNSAAQSGRI